MAKSISIETPDGKVTVREDVKVVVMDDEPHSMVWTMDFEDFHESLIGIGIPLAYWASKKKQKD